MREDGSSILTIDAVLEAELSTVRPAYTESDRLDTNNVITTRICYQYLKPLGRDSRDVLV